MIKTINLVDITDALVDQVNKCPQSIRLHPIQINLQEVAFKAREQPTLPLAGNSCSRNGLGRRASYQGSFETSGRQPRG